MNKPEKVKTISDRVMEKKGQRVMLICDHKTDKTRQEFRAEADINNVLRRHGVIPTLNRQPLYTEIDYDSNLQAGLAALERERQAWSGINVNIRQRYNSWERVVTALAKKELVVKDGKLQFAPPPETPKNETGKTPDSESGKKPEKKD